MPILKDARGNEYQGWLDQITGGTITDARAITSVLAALNAEVVMDLNGQDTAVFDVRTAAGNLTYGFEGTVDGVNYMTLPAFANFQLLVAVALQEQMVSSVVVATTHSGIYSVAVKGFRRVRLRISAYTSGNITVAARASRAAQIVYTRPLPATLHVTATGAVNTAVTVTLPAAGAGLFHYITQWQLQKLYNVIGVAAGAGVIVTTTNLPGSPAFTTEQLASAAGTSVKVAELLPGNHTLKSSVANTATTFVAPAQLQTIWRHNVSYYVGA